MAPANFVQQYPLAVQGELREVFRESFERVWEVDVVFAGLAGVLVFLEKGIPLKATFDTEYRLKTASKKSVVENNV
jgi:hypothetical protein